MKCFLLSLVPICAAHCPDGLCDEAAMLQSSMSKLSTASLSSLASQLQVDKVSSTSQLGWDDQWYYTVVTAYYMTMLDKGLLVRAPDDGVNAPVVPATFWHNQLQNPNQMYIWFDKKFGYDGTLHTRLPLLAYVADPAKFDDGTLWPDGGNTLTFYGHDSNAVDTPDAPRDGKQGRCTWLPDVGKADKKWDCPGGYFDEDGAFFACSDAEIQPDHWCEKTGAGYHAGRGCHFSQGGGQMDQDCEQGRLCGSNCQCPTDLCNDYDSCYQFAKGPLRDAILQHQASEGTVDDDLDSWGGIDQHICWVDDLDMMAGIQMGLYDTRSHKDVAKTKNLYWGWNEVVVKNEIDSPENWKSNLIFLPANLAAEGHLGTDAQESLSKEIADRLNKKSPTGSKLLEVGYDNYYASGASSSVVFAGEFLMDGAADKFQILFFCLSVQLKDYQVCALDKGDDPEGEGYCYIEKAGKNCFTKTAALKATGENNGK